MDEVGHHPELVALRARAVVLAGTTRDLAQRASVYHHLFAHSGGNHSFPLLAAHGALWASGYFRRGLRFGALVARLRSLGGADPAALMARLETFAERFRDINRRVCVETFFIYWLSADPRLRNEAERVIPPQLLVQMDRCHAARRGGYALNDGERRALFEAFFLWEQANIVGPSIDFAFADFDWPLIHALALRPKIRFAYFAHDPLCFRNFGDTRERIEMGLRAFDRAQAAGWPAVEQALADYDIMPDAFLANPARYFTALSESLLPRPALA